MKIFRKIRQKLIGESKSKKYVIYAIGEVALIIIGILMAVSINNWNEQKSDRVSERQYLTSLVNELDKDITKSESAISGNEILLGGIHDLLQLLAEPNDSSNYWRKVYMHSIKDTYWYMSVNYSESTLGQLINNHEIELITDQELSTAILKYERALVVYKNQQTYMKSYFHEMEETQKSLFDLRLARKAFIFIEESHTNMLKPIDDFQELIEVGNYVIDKDPITMSTYYGDILYYESNFKYLTALLKEQKNLALNLKTLVDSKYGIRVE
ncbi:MAG: hypothetical protein ACI86P_002677 [Flavobacteriales bacterium]|jgi:hypothetical protein